MRTEYVDTDISHGGYSLIVTLFMRRCLVALIFVGMTTFAGCNKTGAVSADQTSRASAKQDNAAKQSDAWVNQELLLQLKEIRTEIAAMKQEVSKLNDTVAKLSVAGAAPAQERAGAQVAKLELTGLPAQGKRSAEVAIVEFSDFECPYCARHHQQVYPQLKKEFIDAGKVRYYSRQRDWCRVVGSKLLDSGLVKIYRAIPTKLRPGTIRTPLN